MNDKIVLTLSRKDHDFLMDSNPEMFKKLMTFEHNWETYGAFFEDIESYAFKCEIAMFLKQSERQFPVKTPQVAW